MTFTTFPAASRRLRLGMVGGGGGALIGNVHAAGARLSGRWDVVAGALSSDPERAKASGRTWHMDDDRIYLDFHDMARAEAARPDGIDAVAIVTPNHLHGPVALAFMGQGIDIVSDKPLCASLDEVDALADAQRASGVVYGLTHAFASYVMVRVARDMVRAGEIGEIKQVHVEYLQDWAKDLTDAGPVVPWRLDPTRSGGSFSVADVGTHAEHLARFVTGLEIEALRAEFHVTGAPKALEDTAYMHLRLSGGVPATLMVSQAIAGFQRGLRLRIAGTAGSMEWHQGEPDLLYRRPVSGPEQVLSRGRGAEVSPAVERFQRMPHGHPEGLSDAWANLYLELAVAIEARRDGRAVPDGLLAYPTLADGIVGMQFIDAAIRSNASGEWVEIA